jgi:hypothetical protein
MGDGVTSTPVRHLLSYVISSPTRGGAFGLYRDDVGFHSLRASAAMAMYLNDVPVVTIM